MKGHPGVLYIDSNEPQAIAAGLSPIMPTTVAPINTWGKADYYWVDAAGNERMVERKQIGEALSDINTVEEQLQRHLHECDELTLLVEGVAMPTSRGAHIFEYNQRGYRDSAGDYREQGWYPGYEFKQQAKLWSRWHSFKYSLWHNAGVHVEEVSHWKGTVECISTAWTKSMDPSNTTLNRYVVPHMPPFHKNPHIDNLCRMQGLGLGEATAIKLIEEFGTVHGVMTAKYTDLVGIMGGAWAKKFLAGIGRED
jgi:hypothetical protein